MLFATHLVEEGEGLLELGDLLLSKLVGHLGGLCGWKMHQKTEKTSFLLSGQRAKSSKIEKKKKRMSWYHHDVVARLEVVGQLLSRCHITPWGRASSREGVGFILSTLSGPEMTLKTSKHNTHTHSHVNDEWDPPDLSSRTANPLANFTG